ncbi:hypothetical protein [Pseudoalteromonas sp.]|uniref:hypothetical protein n=1 Tax=Pseudoalteromonas sp. TaxID=53249 RepID=UPI0030035E5D
MKTQKSLCLIFSCFVFITACDAFNKGNSEPIPAEPWWASLEPDVVIENDEFYLKSCDSVTRVINNNGNKTARVILQIPFRLLTSCPNQLENNSTLQFDGTYLTLTLCRTAIGAGGCAEERYRTRDFEHWQEYIGITWLNGEEYQAWRVLGSKSSKADEISKVIKSKN